ncbi:hypothetical protein [Glaciecola sp. 1036]|uniref:hypothetical protein n=1 Tax=Alteromonadaceae TaxID=72275 RepID=UPI003CFC1015
MDILDTNGYVLVAVTIFACIGIALFFFGSLITVAAAFGKGDKLFGILIILCLPFSAVYCILHPEYTKYPSKYVYTGALLIALTGIGLLFI